MRLLGRRVRRCFLRQKQIQVAKLDRASVGVISFLECLRITCSRLSLRLGLSRGIASEALQPRAGVNGVLTSALDRVFLGLIISLKDVRFVTLKVTGFWVLSVPTYGHGLQRLCDPSKRSFV